MSSHNMLSGKVIELRHSDGYPNGFTPLDNRNIWSPASTREKLLLSPAALGLYVVMKSLPTNWEFNELWLTKTVKKSRDVTRRLLNELEQAGRLIREDQRDARGRFIKTRWVLCRGGHHPLTENPLSANPSPVDPSLVQPATAAPATENRVLLVNKEKEVRKDTTTTSVLIWPSQIEEEQRVVVARWMEGLDQEQQQQALDEFSGAMASGKPPDKPLSWLRGLANKARRGEFVPDRCQQVAQTRARQTSEARRREQQEARAKAKAEAKAKLQEKLDGLSDAQVLALELPEGLSIGDVQAWLASGRPACNSVAAALRHALGEAVA